MCKKLFCFDLDMTLLDHATGQVPESTLQALACLKKQGDIVAIATGRDMDNAFSRGYKELIAPNAIIHCNGQRVTVGDKVVREIFMDKGLIGRMMEFAEQENLCIGFYMDDACCYVHPEQVEAMNKHLFQNRRLHYIDKSYLLTYDFHALAYVGHPDGAKKLEEAFPEVKLPLFAGKEGADIIEKDVAKINGVRALQEYYQIPDDQVIAFGDSMNDYEMIRDAGLGIAMGNAIEPLKEIADFVTKPIGEDGVSYALRHYQFIM